MKKSFILIFIISMLCCCNKISNKPIYEELTIDEVGKAMRQDSTFGYFYDEVVSENLAQKMSPSEKAKFKDVSYKRYFSYMKYKYNWGEWFKKDSIWAKEWAQKYAKEIAATDSVINYWKEYKQNCNSEIDKYIKGRIINVGVESDYEYNWRTDRNEWVSHRTYEIEYALFVPKVDKVTYDLLWRNNYGNAAYGGFSYGGYDVNITKENCIKKSTCAGLSENKPSELWITSIIVNGQVIKTDYDKYKVPEAVQNYILDEKEYDWDKVGYKFAGENFVSKDSYLSQKREEDLRAFDNLCYEFDQEF